MRLQKVDIASPRTLNSCFSEYAVGRTTNMRYSSVALVGRYLYVVGKLCKLQMQGETYAVVAVLDTLANSWRWIPGKGPGFQHSCVFLYKDALYWFGKEEWLPIASTNVSRFDLALEQWEVWDTSGGGPSHRSCFSGHFIEHIQKFVVFGGYITHRNKANDVHLLDMESRRWIEPVVKGRRPEARWKHASCVHKGVVYCYGGWGVGGVAPRDGLFMLHFNLGNSVTWSNPKTNHAHLAMIDSCAFIPFGDVLLICGGYAFTRDHWVTEYNPTRNQFRKVRCSREHIIGSGAVGVSLDRGRKIILIGAYGTTSYICLTA